MNHSGGINTIGWQEALNVFSEIGGRVSQHSTQLKAVSHFAADEVVALQKSVNGGDLSRCQKPSNHRRGDSLTLRFAHVRDHLDSKTPVIALAAQGLDCSRPTMSVPEIGPHQHDAGGQAFGQDRLGEVLVA